MTDIPWFLVAVLMSVVIGIMYVNRPKCVEVGGDCDSSPEGCCSNLTCIQNVCTTAIKDTYKKYSNSSCPYREDGVFTTDASVPKGKTQDEIVKFVMQKCNDCRENPKIHKECLNSPCNSFVVFSNGESILCLEDSGSPIIYPDPSPRSPSVYVYDPQDNSMT